MKSLSRPFTLLTVVALALCGCATPSRNRSAPSTAPVACLPDFPYQAGWLGGDAAYSVDLSNTDTLWLFGDTFVGEPGAANREGSSFIHNSIGISRCDGSRFHIDYFWGTDAEGAPHAFLRDEGADPEAHWWWLFGGFMHGGELFIGLLEVERSASVGPIDIPFRALGMQLARVENPGDVPGSWRVSTRPLWDSRAVVPGSALVVHRTWLYLFTFLQNADGTSPRILARLPLREIHDSDASLPGTLEYLAQNGDWKPGLDAEDARVLMNDNASEMSVSWRPELQRWLATYSHPNAEGRLASRGPSKHVFVRTAQSLEGPWSEPVELYPVPELSTPAASDPDTACYAAKEHARFGREGSVTLTYVCNLFTPPGGDANAVLGRLLRDMSLYRPQTTTVQLPVEPSRGGLEVHQ